LQAVQKLLFFPSLQASLISSPPYLPLWWRPFTSPKNVHNKTQNVFVQHQDVSEHHHQDTSWLDKRAVREKKRCRQSFLYCLQRKTTYVHILYLPLMCSRNLVKIIIIILKKKTRVWQPQSESFRILTIITTMVSHPLSFKVNLVFWTGPSSWRFFCKLFLGFLFYYYYYFGAHPLRN
jgi:hypothetical protein